MTRETLLEELRKKSLPEYIINAFSKVKREDFVPDPGLIGYAYDDIVLPIENGSSLAQPSTIAYMLSVLEPKQGQKILEVGSGSGYVLALLSEIVKDGKVFGVEIIKRLAVKSKNLLYRDSNVQVINRDGSEGLREFAPYDRIIVSASCDEIPYHLLNQLREGGILVAAVKNSIFQVKKERDVFTQKESIGFAFVPLVRGEIKEESFIRELQNLPNNQNKNNKTQMTLCLIYTPHEVLLGLKKEDKFGGGRWNGYGGKFDAAKGDKNLEDTAIREIKEETNILGVGLKERGLIEFHFEDKPDKLLEVHLYSLNAWNGNPKATEEMPEHKWFSHTNIPYSAMWPADKFWMPYILEGKNVYGRINFKDINTVLSHDLRIE